MKNIYITLYTREEGKLELTKDQWQDLNTFSLTYHRENGPAKEWFNRSREWYINGKLHREDGPAVEYVNDKYWLINDRPHRESRSGWWQDDTAVKYSDETKYYWFINGEEYYKTDYNKLLEEVDSLEPILGLTDPRDWVRKRFERKYKKAI